VVEVALTITWVVLWVCLVALLVYAAGYAITGASLIDPGHVTWPAQVPALVIGAVFLVGALIIVGRLRRLFDSFTSGEPFRRENAAHLRAIWITMLAMEVARYVLLAGVAAMFAAVGAPEGASADFNIPHPDLSTWLSIAVLIVLAEVFREGARMKEEQELTI
jgi:hypothetical protein